MRFLLDKVTVRSIVQGLVKRSRGQHLTPEEVFTIVEEMARYPGCEQIGAKLIPIFRSELVFQSDESDGEHIEITARADGIKRF